MIAADILRAAIEDTNTLRVDTDAWDELTVWDKDDNAILGSYTDDGQSATRLIGLLLAAAPHLADLLDAPLDSPAIALARIKVRAAITEAGESL